MRPISDPASLGAADVVQRTTGKEKDVNSGRKIVTSIAANPGAVKPCFVGHRMQSVLGLRRKIAGASVVVALVAAGLTAVPASVLAQTSNVIKSQCTFIGYNPPEPLGDRPGHSISLSEFTCVAGGGPLDGGVMSGTQIYEWDGINGVGIAGFGVLRGRGGHVVYVNTEVKNTLTITDGKVTGFLATGRGHYPVAAGTAASFQGKTYSYVAKPGPGPGRFVLEATID